MTAPSLTLAVVRLRLLVWRYRARRAALRLMRRLLDWMEPAG
jgi:hypothetical protein